MTAWSGLPPLRSLVRIALAPINPTVGDIAGNADAIVRAIADARRASCDLIAFPELSICGYPPRDLLLQEGFVRAACEAAAAIGREHSAGITVVLGLPLPRDSESFRDAGPIHNSLLVYRDGARVAYYDKRLLPTYDVFDEDRYFEPGARAVVIDVPCASGATRVGLAICEDLWKGEDAGFAHRYDDAPDPVPELVGAGARVVLVPSASPFVLRKGARHRAILARHARDHRVHVASLNQFGGNDELVFDGHALVYGPTGELEAGNEAFSGEVLVVDVGAGARAGVVAGGARGRRPEGDERDLYDALVLGIRDYLRKTGFKSAIIGLSGGIDSALTAALAVAALGPGHVLGVAMPGAYSSAHSIEDALDLARRLGIACPTIPIDPAVNGFRATLDPALRERGQGALGHTLPDVAEENLQSRVRGTILMALSNRTGAIVITTGNKSELAVGYCTLYGDMNGGLAALSDVSKQQVYALSRWINRNHAVLGFASAPIPARSIDKAPSAELRPNQTDQDSLPPYEDLDRVLERYVEGRQAPARIVRDTGLDEATVRRVVRMIDLAEYKRKQAAMGIKVTSVAFGSGRRVPNAQGWRPR